jgi:hypothetical protein
LAVPAGAIGYLEPAVLLYPSRMFPNPIPSTVFDPATKAYKFLGTRIQADIEV